MSKQSNAERAKNFRKRQKEKAKAAGQQKNPARTSTERSREHRAREREKKPNIISRPTKPLSAPMSLETNCSQEVIYCVNIFFREVSISQKSQKIRRR